MGSVPMAGEYSRHCMAESTPRERPAGEPDKYNRAIILCTISDPRNQRRLPAWGYDFPSPSGCRRS